jgi:hypothetical protein
MKVTIEITQEEYDELNEIVVGANTTLKAAIENIIQGWVNQRIKTKYTATIQLMTPTQIKTAIGKTPNEFIGHAESIIKGV